MIRALIAEDSVTSLQLLLEILGSDPEIRVVGTAKDGQEAVEMTVRLRPDVVLMDIRMPRMDGFEATRQIMVEAPTPIVIVSASLNVAEVEISMQALRCGALSVLPKPPGPQSPQFEEACRQLLSTLKAMADVKVVRRWAERPAQQAAAPPISGADSRFRAIAIATSTGGPAALYQILSALPSNFPVPILAVQHIADGFVGGLASWLNGVCGLRVKVAENREALAARTVYIAPNDHHLGLSDPRTVLLSGAPPIAGFRPSGTFLFRSVARVLGASAVSVILTGMGQDGVEGLHDVRRAGGHILAQDEKSSIVFGMPGAAIAAKLPDEVLALDLIAARLRDLGSGT